MIFTKKNRKWYIIGGLVAVIGGWIIYGVTHKKSTIEYTTADVTHGTLIQTVSETGSITPAKDVDLNFATTGQLVSLAVKVGDKVSPNQPLAQINSSNLAIRQQEANANLNVSRASVAQAQSSYDSARREYTKLSASLTETLTQALKTKADLEDRSNRTVTTAEQSIITAETNLAATKVSYQRGIANKTDALNLTITSKLSSTSTALDAANRILKDEYARADLGANDPVTLTETRRVYAEAFDMLNDARTAVAQVKTNHSSENLIAAYSATQLALNRTLDTLNLLFTVLQASTTSRDFKQAALDAFKANVDNQLALMSNASSALQSARQGYDDAQLSYDTNVLAATQNLSQANISYDNAVTSARNAVATATASRDQQLASAQSRVDNTQAQLAVVTAQVGQALANAALIRDQISENTLKSPIKGVITQVNYQIGEQVSPQKAFVSVLTENNYQLEVDISETDINKVKTGDKSVITLDSLGEGTKFQGAVYFIDPAQTIIQGVTYYKIKISFDPGKIAVKPGMTANTVIATNRRDNIIMMPARAVVEKDGKKIVRILENGIPREAEVSIGLAGDDGLVEVLSGVKEGDKVVTFVKDSSKK